MEAPSNQRDGSPLNLPSCCRQENVEGLRFMANQWLRLWHDMPTDPKWRVIAKVSGRPIAEVVSVYASILVKASAHVERGRVPGAASRDMNLLEGIAATYEMEVNHVAAILEAMQGRVLDGEAIANWEKRQPLKEDGGTSEKQSSSNYVYYVAATDNDAVKVAISRNPWARIRDLQAGSDKKFTLLATLKTDATSASALHEILADSRLKGEWFAPTNALNSLIEKTKQNEFESLEACLDFLQSLPAEDYVATAVDYGSSVVTTKDKDTDKDKEKINTSGEPASPSTAAAVREVFEFWKAKLGHPKAVFDGKRKRLIEARLKNFTVDDLKAAITGCSLSPYHMGVNSNGTRYDGLDLILRDAEHVEKFMKIQPTGATSAVDSANWHESNSGIEAKARELGMEQGPDQWHVFKRKVIEAARARENPQ